MRPSRVIKQAGQGLRRNLTMTVAGVLTVMVAIVLLAGGLIVRGGADQVKANVFQQLNVNVYLQNNAPPSELTTIRTDLQQLPQVKSIRYVSQQEAYQLFKEYYAGQPNLIALTKPSELPASYVVSLVNPQDFEVVNSAMGCNAEEICAVPGVQSVSNGSQNLAHLFSLLHAITVGAVALAVLALVATALLIYNAMQVSAFSRRRETGIMRLVGASSWSIQMPFVLEGAAIGAVGGLLAFGLLMGVRVWITDHIAIGIFSPFGEIGRWVGTLPFILAVGVGLSAIMSFFTLQRHLRV